MKAMKNLSLAAFHQFITEAMAKEFQRIHKPCIPHHRDTSKFAPVYTEMYPEKVVALQKGQATIIKARIALTLYSIKLNPGNYDLMRSLLQEINWENMEDMTAELAWKYFSEHFYNIISQTVPTKYEDED